MLLYLKHTTKETHKLSLLVHLPRITGSQPAGLKRWPDWGYAPQAGPAGVDSLFFKGDPHILRGGDARTFVPLPLFVTWDKKKTIYIILSGSENLITFVQKNKEQLAEINKTRETPRSIISCSLMRDISIKKFSVLCASTIGWRFTLR